MPLLGSALFRNRRLAHKFLLLFGTLLLVLALGFGAVLFYVTRLNSYVDRHQRITVPAVVTAGGMRQAVFSANLILETVVSGRVALPAATMQLEALYARLRHDLDLYRANHAARTHPVLFGMLAQHRRLDLADREDLLLDTVRTKLEYWIGSHRRVLAAVPGRMRDLTRRALAEADTLGEQLAVTLNDLVEVHVSIDREMKLEGDRLQRQATYVIAGLAVVLCLGVVGTYSVVTLSIARPLRRLANNAGRVAQHDLSATFETWPARDEVGELARSLSVMLANLRDRTRALERKTQELEAFTYSVAHDLKGPLREIEGFAALVGQQAAQSLDEPSRRHLAMIRTAALRMTELIEALLRYSRLEQESLPKTRLNLAALVEDVVGSRRTTDSEDAPHLAVDVGPFEIWAEPTSLHQALTNLVDNALKFSRHSTPSYVGIGAAQRPNGVLLWVRDNGVGFEPSQAERLFGLFVRLHPDTEYEGTGVGLAIVKLVMDKHGGRVWAESSPGKGATFYLEFPVQA